MSIPWDSGTAEHPFAQLAGVTQDGRIVAFALQPGSDSGSSEYTSADFYLVDQDGPYVASSTAFGAAIDPSSGMTAMVAPEGSNPMLVLVSRRASGNPDNSGQIDPVPGATGNDPGLVWVSRGSVSPNVRYLVFETDAASRSDPDTMHVYFVDTTTGSLTPRLVDHTPTGQPGSTNGVERTPTSAMVADDGSAVAFGSVDSDLVPNDDNGAADVFLWLQSQDSVSRVSVGADGQAGQFASALDSMSGDGRYVVFETDSPNLVPQDLNGRTDVFMRDTVAGTTTLVSAGVGGRPASGQSWAGSVSGDGRYVAFLSDATDLVQGTANESHLFVRDVVTGVTHAISTPAGYVAADLFLSANGRTLAYVATQTTASGPMDQIVVARTSE
jgi:Tol biopolymer transport system component